MISFFQKRGVVAKITGNSCIILSSEGTYAKVPLPFPEIKVGAEILYRVPLLSKSLKPMLLVASVLILFMSFYLVDQVIIPQQAVAYVSLDIDPSLEMSVDKNMRVIKVHCFNDNAVSLVEPLELEGKMLESAIAELINHAIDMKYLTVGQDNILISSISSSQEPFPVNQEALYEVMEESLASRGCSGHVEIYKGDKIIHTAAKDNNISAGKYIIYEQLIKSGRNVNLDDIRQETVGQLATAYNLDLLPEDDEIRTEPVQTNHGEVSTERKELVAGDYKKNQENVNFTGRENDNRQDENVSRSYSSRNNRIAQILPIEITTAKKESLVDNHMQWTEGLKKNEKLIAKSSKGESDSSKK